MDIIATLVNSEEMAAQGGKLMEEMEAAIDAVDI